MFVRRMKLTVRDKMPVIRPVLMTRPIWSPWKSSLSAEGGFIPLGNFPI